MECAQLLQLLPLTQLELCRAHTPRAHCAIYAIAFASVHAWLFCELQKIS